MQIYIMHCKSLVERKKHMQDIISKYSFTDVEWILDNDATELTSEQLAMFCKTLKKQEISLFLKHINAYRHMIANQIQYALIFEDDVILHPDFNHILETYVKSLPEDWDYLFIGDGCNLHAKTIGNNHLYRVQSTRCADSYLINLKSASAIIKYFDNLVKINNSIDKISKINGYTYIRKDTGKIETGLVAQEVIKILPEVVNLDNSTNYYNISYGNMNGLLVEGIKELNERLSRIENLMNLYNSGNNP